jgi:hypothetical protein
VDRRIIGSWLSGPSSLAEAQGIYLGYRGERLGLPQSGPGSVASYGRRLAATFIDWMIAQVIALGLLGAETPRERGMYTMGVFALMQVLLVGTIGSGIGGRLLRIRAVRLDGKYFGLGPALLRAGLVLLVFPAVVWDRDTRGLHDQITRSVVINRVRRGGKPAKAPKRPAAKPAPKPAKSAGKVAAKPAPAPAPAPAAAEPVAAKAAAQPAGGTGPKAPAAKPQAGAKRRPKGKQR